MSLPPTVWVQCEKIGTIILRLGLPKKNLKKHNEFGRTISLSKLFCWLPWQTYNDFSLGSVSKKYVFQVKMMPRMWHTKFIILILFKSSGLLMMLTWLEKNCLLESVTIVLRVWVCHETKNSIFWRSNKA